MLTRMIFQINLLIIFLLSLTFLVACGEVNIDEDSLQIGPLVNDDGESVYIDSHGQTWEKIGAVEYLPSSSSVPVSKEYEPLSETPIEELIDYLDTEQLAERYRMIMVSDGVEYQLSVEDAIAFTKDVRAFIQENKDVQLTIPAESESTEDEEDLPPRGLPEGMVFPPDERENKNHIADEGDQRRIAAGFYGGPESSSYSPMCTAFKLINNHTAITAAHCIYDRKTESYFSPYRWWFGAGAHQTTEGASKDPLPTGCYQAIIPPEWITNGGAAHDWAILRLSGGPGADCPFEDYDVGTLSVTTVGGGESMTAIVGGYPASGESDSPDPDYQCHSISVPPYEVCFPSWYYPTLWSHWEDAWTNSVTFPTRIFHEVDTSGGQSGAPIRNLIGQVVGIHKGSTYIFPGGWRNHGRRMDAELLQIFDFYKGFD